MKIIYPESTLQLLAKYDELIENIADTHKRHYPEKDDKWFYAMQNNSYYQACIRQKMHVIDISTYTIQLDAGEAANLIPLRKTGEL